MNKNNPIYLASIKSGISIEEICEKARISKTLIKEWDVNPHSASYVNLKPIIDYTGVSMDNLFNNDEDNSPIFQEVYQGENESVISLIEENRNKVHLFREKSQIKNDEELMVVVDEIIDKYDNFAEITLRSIRKPVVCAFGKSDTGKSTLINYIFNEEVAHADYNPLTSAIVYYHHVDEMPEYLKRLQCNAFVFGVKNGGRKRSTFSHEDIFDSKAMKHLIANGSFSKIMDQFSTRSGENYANKEYKVFEIDVFLENNVLKEMSFIDIPGFESDDKNDDVGLQLNNEDIDVVFYLSVADAFMRPDDFPHLRNRLISRKNADGVFVLATHAQAVGGPIKVGQILDGGCNRFYNNLTEQNRNEFEISSCDELRKHFYAFDIGNAKYCSELNKAFVTYIEDLVKKKSQEAKEKIAEECKRLNTYYLERKNKVSATTDFQKKVKN